MQYLGYAALLAAQIAALAGAAFSLFAALQRPQTNDGRVSRWAIFANGGFLTASAAILTWALVSNDFSFAYVADYTDRALPLFYRLTAFWAGQEGSLLFWAWAAAVIGCVFALSPAERQMPTQKKLFFWAFYLSIQAFFLLVLTSWSNPFQEVMPAPSDGNGLNPLLRHPGMVFHPPLLFLGYAGFGLPACAALAHGVSGVGGQWIRPMRNWTLLAWVFLTIGIILGAWWSYMELGWGGYWAWDPVENASLIPWLTGTAFLHTAAIEQRTGALKRSNVALIVGTYILCLFGTYIVRTGVVQSLHAFGDSGLGLPLLLAMSVMALFVPVSLWGGMRSETSVPKADSRAGVISLGVWLLIFLSVVILLGTMWPVLSSLWSQHTVGLGPAFFNRVCTPLFAMLPWLFAVAPFRGWRGGSRDSRGLAVALGSGLLTIGAAASLGVRMPVVLLALGGGGACLMAAGYCVLRYPQARRSRKQWGMYLAHAALALMVIGVALSGPLKISQQTRLAPGESFDVGGYRIMYASAERGQRRDMTFQRAVLEIRRGDKVQGYVRPERRVYANFKNKTFVEAGVLPSLGREVYGVLMGLGADDTATVKVSINPGVNWIWIGGTLLCLAGLVVCGPQRSRRATAQRNAQEVNHG